MSSPNSALTLAAFSDDVAALVERVGASTVALQARRSYPSSAVVIQPGIVVTAAHTLRREDGITAVQADGSAVSATLVGVDPGTDIAVLRLDSSQGPPIAFGDAAAVRTGHFVVAVSRGTEGTLAASAGIVARTGGEWRTWRGGHLDRLVQLDGGLWTGFSGGPVVDARGGVIGIGTSALSRGRAVVIPGSVLTRATEQLLSHGRVTHAYLGAAVQPVEIPAALREKLSLPHANGLIVVSTVPQGPADAAGVMLGDTLLTLNGKPLAEIEDLKAAVNSVGIGKSAPLTLIRGGQAIDTSVTIGERPRDRC